MKGIYKATSQRLNQCVATLTTGLYALGFGLPGFAQVTSDGTTSTVVNPINNNIVEILNGREEGNNLFHSFRDFSVSQGMEAQFNLNNTSITTIFSRVTGGNVSHIDGTISIVGNPSASLFLLNPAGIIFGQNAKLDIGGSFVGTTANSIKFSDGTEFSAVNPSSSELLTMSVPIGLQMGQNPGDISVQGAGHQLIGGLFAPAIRSITQSSLQVNSGQAIALVGKNVSLSGGVLTTENGRIELGAVQVGTVGLKYTSSDLQLDYVSVESFGDIQLVKQSLVDASGLTSAGIHLQGQNISLKDGSAALIQTVGTQPPSSIRVDAAGWLDLSGNVRISTGQGIATEVISSSLITENLGAGRGADIDVSAENLRFNDGGIFMARNYGAVSGGDITVNVAGNIQANGSAFLNPNIASGIFTPNFSSSSAKSGNISVIASNIALTDGGMINTINFGQGDSGNLDVKVSGTIEIRGINTRTLSPANIGSTVFRQGNSGDLNLNTTRLIIEDGGNINSTTFNSGNGGQITINALEFIEVKGSSPNLELFSSIGAQAVILSEVFRQNFGLPDRPSGNASNLIINTPKLQIDKLGQISVDNQGSGNAGNININTNSLLVTNQGKLLASTASGEGGNIELSVRNLLIMRDRGLISTDAQGRGNGGNITINTPIIVGLENSDIIANAFQGRGGNINITTQGIIGLEFRNTLTPREDLTNNITASSEFNVNGTVQINNIGIDPNSGLIELPANVTDSSQQIARGCADTSGSSFVATGRGGIPQNPMQDVRSDRPWSDIRDISVYSTTSTVTAETPPQPNIPVQATSWHRRPDGKVELIATQPSYMQPSLTCAHVAAGRSKLF